MTGSEPRLHGLFIIRMTGSEPLFKIVAYLLLLLYAVFINMSIPAKRLIFTIDFQVQNIILMKCIF